jgi:hypothetical protein
MFIVAGAIHFIALFVIRGCVPREILERVKKEDRIYTPEM